MIRLALFVDGSFMFYCQQEQGWDIVFKILPSLFAINREVRGCFYLCGTPSKPLPTGGQKFSIFKYRLAQAGYNVIESPGEIVIDGKTGSPIPKHPSLKDATCSKVKEEIDCYDLGIVFGAGEFDRELIDRLRQRRKWLLVVAPAHAQCDTGDDPIIFIDINDIRTDIEFKKGGLPQTGRKASKARDILPLHPMIIKKSYSLYMAGSYAKAVEAAFNAVDTFLREFAGLRASGTNLVTRALGGKDPIVKLRLKTDNQEQARAQANEQEGFLHLFSGVWRLRGPIAHEHVTYMTKGTAIKYLSLASLLIERLEEPGVVRGETK